MGYPLADCNKKYTLKIKPKLSKKWDNINSVKNNKCENKRTAPPRGVWVGVWFSSRLYYPFGKGPGPH